MQKQQGSGDKLQDSSWQAKLLGGYLLIITLYFIYLLINFWPDTKSSQQYTIWPLYAPVKTTYEQNIMIIALICGALGSQIHALASYASNVGKVRFRTAWISWYLFRLPLGALLAIVFYFAIRGGLVLLVNSDQTAPIKLDGIAGVSMLVGLFTEQASHKLKELFDTLFATNHSDKHKIKIDGIAPTTCKAGSEELLISILGENMSSGLKVSFDNKEFETRFISKEQCTVVLPGAVLQESGTRILTILEHNDKVVSGFVFDINMDN